MWINGTLLGHHSGGSTPFYFDITSATAVSKAESFFPAEDDSTCIHPTSPSKKVSVESKCEAGPGTVCIGESAMFHVVVRARDDIRSGVQPAGKQSQASRSQGCFYTRTTGTRVGGLTGAYSLLTIHAF